MGTLTSLVSSPGCEQLLDKPRIYQDLNSGGKVDDSYIVTLNNRDIVTDLKKSGTALREGMILDFWSDDGDENGNPDPLLFQGIVQFDTVVNQWVAIVDWNKFIHASDLKNIYANSS